MKVTTVTLTAEGQASRDYRGMYAIEVDGKTIIEIWEGEPEDNNLYRNFNDIFSIPKLLQTAYDAGKRGEALSFESIEVDEYDS